MLGHDHRACVAVAEHFSKDLRGHDSMMGSFPVRCGRWISPFDPLVLKRPDWPVIDSRGFPWLEYGPLARLLLRLLRPFEGEPGTPPPRIEQRPLRQSLGQGWGWSGANAWHYFREGRSLCRETMHFGRVVDRIPSDYRLCFACLRELSEEDQRRRRVLERNP